MPRTVRRRLLALSALVHTLAVAAVLEVALRTLPLPRIARALGVALALDAEEAPRPDPPKLLLTPAERRRLRAVDRVMRHWRLSPGICLRQALLAGYHLRRHGPRLHLGVRRFEGAFGAHAWLDVAGAVLGGQEGFEPLVGLDDAAR